MHRIGREFKGPPHHAALRDITLEIEPGEFVAIVGASGSGKSTLLNILGLLDSPTDGAYSIGEVEARGLTKKLERNIRARTFGFIFQESHVLADRTVAQNIALKLATIKTPYRDRMRLVNGALAKVGLQGRGQQDAGTLSGGERQRVAIARALVGNPPVVLADEPTGSLDRANSEVVLSLLGEAHQSGRTVVVVTHDPVVMSFASRVITISDGCIDEPR